MTAHRWAPIMGEFEILDDRILFKGREHPPTPSDPLRPISEPSTAVGILLSNQKFVNGRLGLGVEFAAVAPNSQCELIVGYDLKTKAFVSAGIGGGFAMFSVREWIPSTPQQPGTWITHELSGERANLRSGLKYDLRVRVQGSTITLEVDGVEVAEKTLPSTTNRPNQVGVFCLSPHEITMSDFSAEVERPQVFIVMQFSSPYNEVYSHVIKDVCDEFRMEAVRADELYGPGIIVQDVISRIERSQFVIADITPPNPNVYFEVGYALALGKPIILLAQQAGPQERLPFDLSAFRVLFYDDSIGGKPRLESGLRNHLREILGGN